MILACHQRFTALFVVSFLLVMSAALPAQTKATASSEQLNFRDDTWHVSISPYLWMAGMNGSVAFGGHEVRVDQSFGDILGNLKFGVMALSEVRRGRIALLTDLMYIRLSDETAIPVEGLPGTLNVKTSLNTFTLTQYFGYRILGNQRGSIDFLTGGRYYHVDPSITADAGLPTRLSFSTTNNWADFVEGGRLVLNLTPRIGTFLIGDVGGGGSVLTWQLMGGVGYKWSKRWSTSAAYRRLYFNRQTSNGFGLEQTQHGFIVGATYRFR
jgi:opacity protein-like surface antigen